VKYSEYVDKHYDGLFKQEPKLKKPKKRGRKPGVKVGPYKTINLREMMKELKELSAKVAKLEKVFN
jgi:hypothetical protein